MVDFFFPLSIYCLSLLLLISFVLKPIFTDTKMAISACFIHSLALNIYFPSLHPTWCLFLVLRCIFSCFPIHSFIEELRPLVLRVINEQGFLIPVICCCVDFFSLFFLLICRPGIIYSCVFTEMVDLFRLEFSLWSLQWSWICRLILLKFGFTAEYLSFSLIAIESFAEQSN